MFSISRAWLGHSWFKYILEEAGKYQHPVYMESEFPESLTNITGLRTIYLYLQPIQMFSISRAWLGHSWFKHILEEAGYIESNS